MALPYRGDEDFGARRGSYTPAVDVDPVKRTETPTRMIKSGFGSVHSSDISAKSGCVARLQEQFARCCCSKIEDLPPWLFIIFLLIFIAVLALAVAAVVAFILTKSSSSKSGPSETGNLTVPDDGSNKTISERPFYLSVVPPPNVALCPGFGFACVNEPEKTVSAYQRCDGHNDCSDGSDEQLCKSCQTSIHCIHTMEGNETKSLTCIRGNRLCDVQYLCHESDNIVKRFCGGTKCKAGEYKCKSGPCIPEVAMCDGDQHCPGNDDETNCNGKCKNDAVWCKSRKVCIPKWKQCDGTWDCDDGIDEKHCTCATCCGKDRVLCKTSNQCIKREYVCDGYKDCESGEDEEACDNGTTISVNVQFVNKVDKVKCADNRLYQKWVACSGVIEKCRKSCDSCNTTFAFTCKDDKKCVPKSLLCDGLNDCDDGSDEENCRYRTYSNESLDLFECHTAIYGNKITLLPRDLVCDGVENCRDGSDEKDCNSCSNGAKLCKHTRACIPALKLCDGYPDCADGSDEENCTGIDCAFRHTPLYKCAESDRCIRYEYSCVPGTLRCLNETLWDKAFCVRQSLFLIR